MESNFSSTLLEDHFRKRELIRDYFECLERINNFRIPDPKIVEEPTIKKFISSFITSVNQRRFPTLQEPGFWVYIFAGAFVFLFLFNKVLCGILSVVAFYLSITLKEEREEVKPYQQPRSPRASDEEIQEWLLQDIRGFVERGKEELDIHEGLLAVEQPIILVSGIISENSSKNFEIAENNRILINKEDYFAERGIDGRLKFSIYGFMVIFLCENFLSYYRCYWNFLRGASVNDETGEYLYDSIVSVKNREESSTNIQNIEILKRVYREYFTITTMDAQEATFTFYRDRTISVKSSLAPKSPNYITEAKLASRIIRDMVRQRRVDYQTYKSLTEDTKEFLYEDE